MAKRSLRCGILASIGLLPRSGGSQYVQPML
jgi:hypothetical protein